MAVALVSGQLPQGFFEEDYRVIQQQLVVLEDRLAVKIDGLADGLGKIHDSLEGPTGMFVRLAAVEQQLKYLAGAVLLGIPIAWDWLKKQLGWHS